MSLAQPADKAQVAPAAKAVNRRTVLAGALAAGAGVGAVRLWGARTRSTLQDAQTAQQVLRRDWVSPLGGGQARVAHLLRRTSFGASPQELEEAAADGFDGTVDRLLETKPAQPPALNQASGRLNLPDLQLWWVEHMLASPTPFAERLTLFWHGHFTSDFRKVGLQTPFIHWQNLTWRDMAMGNLRQMLMQVTTDPAMLRYLDLATSIASSPNENYSRELMELFAMGADTFSEEDVRQGALALTGWQLPRPDSTAAANGTGRMLPVYTSQKSGVFNQRRAFKGSVTYLGKTGALDTQGVIDRILAQPSTAPFITTRVLQHFVARQPASSLVNRLADAFRRSKYDMKTLMRSVFTSDEFRGAGTYRALVKSPTEFMVQAARALDATKLSKLIVASGSGMGQMLFDPPDVGGWPNNEAWISSNTVIERVNFVTGALAQATSLPPSSDAVKHQLDGIVGPQTASMLNSATDERIKWFVALASPEFQLK